MKFFGYDKCGTCRKAKKVLKDQNIQFEDLDITQTPPGKTILKQALKERELKKLFNTSGKEYRSLNIKDKLPGMSNNEAIDLLASNGRLIKRPIAVDGERITVGFDEKEFLATWT